MNLRTAHRVRTVVAFATVALVAALVFARPAAASSVASHILGEREAIGRYRQDLDIQVSIDRQLSFLRSHAATVESGATVLADRIDAELRGDPAVDHADELAAVSRAARDFVTGTQRALDALDAENIDGERVVHEALNVAHAFGSALEAYPITWLDRIVFAPTLTVVLGAGVVVAALALGHAVVWVTARRETWAQRDLCRLHADSFRRASITALVDALMLFVLVTRHSLDNDALVVVAAVLAVGGLGTTIASELRKRPAAAWLKEHDRRGISMSGPRLDARPWAPAEPVVVRHDAPIVPLLPAERLGEGVVLLGEGLRTDADDREP